MKIAKLVESQERLDKLELRVRALMAVAVFHSIFAVWTDKLSDIKTRETQSDQSFRGTVVTTRGTLLRLFEYSFGEGGIARVVVLAILTTLVLCRARFFCGRSASS